MQLRMGDGWHLETVDLIFDYLLNISFIFHTTRIHRWNTCFEIYIFSALKCLNVFDLLGAMGSWHLTALDGCARAQLTTTSSGTFFLLHDEFALVNFTISFFYVSKTHVFLKSWISVCVFYIILILNIEDDEETVTKIRRNIYDNDENCCNNNEYNNNDVWWRCRHKNHKQKKNSWKNDEIKQKLRKYWEFPVVVGCSRGKILFLLNIIERYKGEKQKEIYFLILFPSPNFDMRQRLRQRWCVYCHAKIKGGYYGKEKGKVHKRETQKGNNS